MQASDLSCQQHSQFAAGDSVGGDSITADGALADSAASSRQPICRSCRLRSDAEKFFTIYKDHR